MFYKLLDTGAGEKLEQWGEYTLVRPDPQIIWQKSLPSGIWDKADAFFRDDKWHKKAEMPDNWILDVRDLRLEARLTPFKHTGIFPEQLPQWDWLSSKIEDFESNISVLNLFGYTGAASLICARAGAQVVHIDGSHPAIGWARHNQELSGLSDKPIRWILEDVVKFVLREGRRGNQYQGIILDPPAFGHGPEGETWQFNKSMPILLEALKPIIAPDCRFILINAYAISTSAVTLSNVLQDLMGSKGKIEIGEAILEQENSPRKLSTGIWGRWSV